MSCVACRTARRREYRPGRWLTYRAERCLGIACRPTAGSRKDGCTPAARSGSRKGHMMRSNIFPGAICGLIIALCPPAFGQGPPSDDPASVLVGRLDLEKYKATIRGLAEFGHRRHRACDMASHTIP